MEPDVSIECLQAAAAAVVALLLWLGAVTGRSRGTNGDVGTGEGSGYLASPDSYSGSGHCDTGDSGGGDCGGGD